MKFSQKIGKTLVRDLVQIDSIDEKLENRLWNTIQNNFFKDVGVNINFNEDKESEIGAIFLDIWQEFFLNRIDEIFLDLQGNIITHQFINYVKIWFFKSEWYEKYDFLEFLSKFKYDYFDFKFIYSCNNSLKKEMSAYRLIDSCIVQITSEEEVSEIQDAISNSSEWNPVYVHLKTAINCFGNRENPDYRNSVKESISAVECFCKIIVGSENTTLAPALKLIEEKYKIHGALKSAFNALYGYTSDSGGIRHSLLTDDIEVTMEDAKFMLVSCSAFINYLKVKINK